MAIIYKVVENFDKNAVPGANLVVDCFDWSVAYNAQPGIGATTTLTIAYHDSKGFWIVGAEQAVIDTLPDPKYDLDDVFANDRGDWGTYAVFDNTIDGGHIKRGRDFKLDLVPFGIWVAFEVGAPLPVEYLPFSIDGTCTKIKPETKSSLGAFRASESSSVWVGDV